jgi:hypothetical protein
MMARRMMWDAQLTAAAAAAAGVVVRAPQVAIEGSCAAAPGRFYVKKENDGRSSCSANVCMVLHVEWHSAKLDERDKSDCVRMENATSPRRPTFALRVYFPFDERPMMLFRVAR